MKRVWRLVLYKPVKDLALQCLETHLATSSNPRLLQSLQQGTTSY